MKLTTGEKTLLKGLVNTNGWELAEKILAEEVSEILNLDNIDLSQDIDKQVYGRIEHAKALKKFLKTMRLLTREPVKIKPEKYI